MVINQGVIENKEEGKGEYKISNSNNCVIITLCGN